MLDVQAAQAPYTELVTSSGLRLRIGHVSQRNVTPEEPLSKPNQDAFCIETGLGDPDTHLLAVFDGHGKAVSCSMIIHSTSPLF